MTVTAPHDSLLIAVAGRKAARLYPGVIGEILQQEIMSLDEFRFLGAGSRPDRLYHHIRGLPD